MSPLDGRLHSQKKGARQALLGAFVQIVLMSRFGFAPQSYSGHGAWGMGLGCSERSSIAPGVGQLLQRIVDQQCYRMSTPG